jgi:hypothetical protein
VRGFLERLIVAVKKAPDRTWRKPLAVFPLQVIGDLGQLYLPSDQGISPA